MRYLIILVIIGILFSGCISDSGNGAQQTTEGSANFQRCMSQCQSGNAGSGAYCEDGCRVQEAEDTNSTSLCDQLDNKANRPSCYGTVAKSAGDMTICNRLPEGTDRNYCVSIFGSPSSG